MAEDYFGDGGVQRGGVPGGDDAVDRQQEYPNLEYIVVDDGSTDRTTKIIRKYQREVSCWFSQLIRHYMRR